jgi:hypothetical protein
MTDTSTSVEGIARCESCSIRKVNMTISLAFLAPDLDKAAIEGRLRTAPARRGRLSHRRSVSPRAPVELLRPAAAVKLRARPQQ